MLLAIITIYKILEMRIGRQIAFIKTSSIKYAPNAEHTKLEYKHKYLCVNVVASICNV
jgi:hypothetical protein